MALLRCEPPVTGMSSTFSKRQHICVLEKVFLCCGNPVLQLNIGIIIGATAGKCNYAHCFTLNLTHNRNPKEGHNRVRHENEKEIERRNGKTVLYGNEFIFLL